MHANFVRAWAYARFVVENGEGVFVLTGAPGVGKSTLISQALAFYQRSSVQAVAVPCHPVAVSELLFLIGNAFGAAVYPSAGETLDSLRRFLQVSVESGSSNLLILDEAQALTDEALEQVRLLSDLNSEGRPLLQLFMVGQEDLRSRLLQSKHEALQQRILASCSLEALGAEPCKQYIRHRWRAHAPEGLDLPFDEAGLARIHAATNGVPRRVNRLCARALLHSRAEAKPRLNVDDVQLVISELAHEGL